MKLIVGLGNPGPRYANTRHNFGSIVVKALAKEYKAAFAADSRSHSRKAKINTEAGPALIALPDTYMNLSGVAVASLVKRYTDELDELLVVADDVSIPFGDMRLRKKGGAGGHKGLGSVIEALGSKEFARLRLGILPEKETGGDLSDFVLAGFNRQEWKNIGAVIENAVMCIQEWMDKGVDSAMNKYNGKTPVV